MDSLEILDKLTPEQGLELFKAIRDYNQGKKLELSLVVDLVFTSFKNQFDRDISKYENICERNKVNGQKGGRPKNPNNPIALKETQKTQENPKNHKSKSKSKNDSKSKSKKQLLNLQTFIDEGYKKETLDALVEHRLVVIKKPIQTDRIMRGLLNALSEYYRHWKISPDEAIEFYLSKNWVSIDKEYKYPHRQMRQVSDTADLSFNDISKMLKAKNDSNGTVLDSRIKNLTNKIRSV